MAEKIENLIFDIGGVLIGYRWQDMLKDYGLDEENANRVGKLIFNDNLWRDFDRGLISYDELMEEYLAKYPEDRIHVEYFLKNCELIRINRPETWRRVEELKALGYGIYILSNYAEDLVKMHVKDMELYNRVDGKIISYQVNYIKPEPEIYKALLDKYNLNPKECLFFDDLQANVDGAEAMGINAKKVNSEAHINELLDELIMSKKEMQ